MSPDRTIASELVLWDETIPGGAYWSRVIRRGTTLRIFDPLGSRGVALLAYNADDPVERYNAPDTVKIQNQVYLTKGHVLFSDMGRVLFSITEDTSGHHDTFGGCSDPASVEARYGPGGYQALRNAFHRDGRTNLAVAIGRHGLGPRDLVPNLNLFSHVRVDPGGALRWVDGSEKPGSFVDLRAEMNVLVALSNTPHPLHPESRYDPREARLIVWRSPPPAADDPCRSRSEEARRAFRNTDELFLV